MVGTSLGGFDVVAGRGPRGLKWRAVERYLVLLVAMHSVGVGAMLLLEPVWSCTTFGGWAEVSPRFFPRQSGIFHFVLAFAYLYEHVRNRGVTILLAAKFCALVFLLVCTLVDHVPWVVPFCGVSDGLMGFMVWTVHRATLRQIDAGTAGQEGQRS